MRTLPVESLPLIFSTEPHKALSPENLILSPFSMLARLSRATARLLDVPLFEPSGSTAVVSEDEMLLVDIDTAALRALVIPLPDIAWQRIAAMCGRMISPLYSSLHNMLTEDAQHLAKLLLELETLSAADFHVDSEVDENAKASMSANFISSDTSDARNHDLSQFGDIIPLDRPIRKRRRSGSAQLDQPLIIPSVHPSIPTIIVTPCPTQPREASCCVPLQDSAFGMNLTVPMHPMFNQCFPPRIPSHSLPQLERWRFVDGHWWAVVPSLDEQARNGMFSRALVIKKRACRMPCARAPS